MINWLIEVALRNRFIVIALFLLIGAWGYWALLTTPIDAIPDLSDNQVIVFSDWSGRSPQEVEDQITYPLTVSLQGLPGVRVVRSASAFGFSMINVIFEDSVDLYFARSRVLERLNLLTKSLPAGVVPTLGPDATGVGHIFWYTVEGKGQSMRDLRSIQDWYIRYQLNSVPGVAEVASIGGEVRQYQIDVDPNRLRAFKLPLSTVVDAVMRSNRNVSGNVVEASGTWSVVRGLGLIESLKDLEQIVVGAENGVPIYVRQVADVKVGDAFRVAALVKGSEEAVGGVVVARYGVSTVDVINRVKEKIAALQAGLPRGVTIVPFYDRSALIERAAHTLKRALIEEAIVVTLVNIVFLLNIRSVLIVTLPIPLAVLTAFVFMHYLGITSNIMSLAGIAIAIGVLLAAAIALAAGPAQAEMKNQWVEYSQGGTKLKAYLVYDDKVTGRRPAVLMIHAREGMTPKTLGLAETWAKLGYVSFAADIFGYGQGVLPKDVPEMQAQIAIYDKDRALMRARTQAAFDVLVRNPMVDPSRIALIGYCFGGGVGVEFAATGAPLAANVAIHGSFRDRAPGWAANAQGMFLILHGAEDVGFPLTTVDRLIEELRSAKVSFQYEVYSGTGHGFSTPKNKAEERANAQSIGTTARTLKELFGI